MRDTRAQEFYERTKKNGYRMERSKKIISKHNDTRIPRIMVMGRHGVLIPKKLNSLHFPERGNIIHRSARNFVKIPNPNLFF